MPTNATLRPKTKGPMVFRSLVKAKWMQHIHKTERERWGSKRTHTLSSHNHLHSRFLKSSHISVTIATLLCLPLLFIPAFLFKSISRSRLFSLVNITETLRLALCSSSFGVAHRKGALAPQRLWGWKSWAEVSTRRFLTPRSVKMLRAIAAFRCRKKCPNFS